MGENSEGVRNIFEFRRINFVSQSVGVICRFSQGEKPKNIGKEEKKKWRGDLTETIGAYERLGLLEL